MSEQLGRDLVAAAVLRGSFRLRSGATSNYYIDKYLFETEPGLLRRLAQALRPLVHGDAQRLAGPVLGAVPLVTAVALEMNLPTLLVRTDKPKEYGTAKSIEGALEPGDRVMLIEDVVTSGGALLAAVEVLRGADVEVLGAVCVVDREEGGAAAIAAAGVPFQALFTKSGLGL
jgi:orotate phosphoribosyltransferase